MPHERDEPVSPSVPVHIEPDRKKFVGEKKRDADAKATVYEIDYTGNVIELQLNMPKYPSKEQAVIPYTHCKKPKLELEYNRVKPAERKHYRHRYPFMVDAKDGCVLPYLRYCICCNEANLWEAGELKSYLLKYTPTGDGHMFRRDVFRPEAIGPDEKPHFQVIEGAVRCHASCCKEMLESSWARDGELTGQEKYDNRQDTKYMSELRTRPQRTQIESLVENTANYDRTLLSPPRNMLPAQSFMPLRPPNNGLVATPASRGPQGAQPTSAKYYPESPSRKGYPVPQKDSTPFTPDASGSKTSLNNDKITRPDFRYVEGSGWVEKRRDDAKPYRAVIMLTHKPGKPPLLFDFKGSMNLVSFQLPGTNKLSGMYPFPQPLGSGAHAQGPDQLHYYMIPERAEERRMSRCEVGFCFPLPNHKEEYHRSWVEPAHTKRLKRCEEGWCYPYVSGMPHPQGEKIYHWRWDRGMARKMVNCEPGFCFKQGDGNSNMNPDNVTSVPEPPQKLQRRQETMDSRDSSSKRAKQGEYRSEPTNRR